eukprot:366190-Chlamydomonas_euryale.AAC.5
MDTPRLQLLVQLMPVRLMQLVTMVGRPAVEVERQRVAPRMCRTERQCLSVPQSHKRAPAQQPTRQHPHSHRGGEGVTVLRISTIPCALGALHYSNPRGEAPTSKAARTLRLMMCAVRGTLGATHACRR